MHQFHTVRLWKYVVLLQYCRNFLHEKNIVKKSDWIRLVFSFGEYHSTAGIKFIYSEKASLELSPNFCGLLRVFELYQMI
jgi:hypothetical protein